MVEFLVIVVYSNDYRVKVLIIVVKGFSVFGNTLKVQITHNSPNLTLTLTFTLTLALTFP